MKKLLSIGICIVMALLCTAQASAADTTQADKYSSFKVIDETITIKNNNAYNYAYLSTFNASSDTVSVIKFVNEDNADEERKVYAFADYISGGAVALSKNNSYTSWTGVNRGDGRGTSFGNNDTRNYNNLDGTYQKVRIKLSDFHSYFNSDGSHDMTAFGDVFSYHFGSPETVDNTTYYSALQLYSGAAYTSVTPDKNGEVEFYMSTKIGQCAFFATDFVAVKGGSSVTSGGGTTRTIEEICKGNVDLDNGGVSIKDATYIQRYLLNLETEPLSDLQKFNADVNNDCEINIIDVTAIQKFLVD